jgi:3-oxoacyl-[acyl-carrier-protein] synthase II
MSDLRRVVVTGIGVVSPAGNWPGDFFERIVAGRSAIRLLPEAERPSPVRIAAWIDQPIDDGGKGTPPDRVSQLALAAGRRALEEAGLIGRPELLSDMAIYLGTGSGGNTTTDQAYHRLYAENQERIAPMSLPRGMNNAAASELSIRHGMKGASNTYSMACASSAAAIGEGLRAIRHGYCDRVLAGGSEAALTFGVFHAWHALRALATPDAQIEASCRPFSADRNGLVLGEGAGFLILESLDSARQRGAVILAELAGYGTSTDATHLTHPNSQGQVMAISQALEDAGIAATAIDYVNAHGTGTLAGDAVEAESLRTVFGEHVLKLPVSSSKAVHGHLLGAGGAVELAVAILAMQQGLVPPTAHCRVPDRDLGIDMVAEGPRHHALTTVMSNSFAFGGSNVVLIARRLQP